MQVFAEFEQLNLRKLDYGVEGFEFVRQSHRSNYMRVRSSSTPKRRNKRWQWMPTIPSVPLPCGWMADQCRSFSIRSHDFVKVVKSVAREHGQI